LLESPPDSGAGSKEFTMMKKMSAAGVAAVMIASQTMAGDAVQWRVEDGGNGHWYALSVVGPIAWPLANSAAATRGGHLATLTSESEKSFAKAVIAATPGYGESAVRRWGPWLGAYQDRKAADYSEPVGGWRWVTGEVWDFAAWSQNQPDNWCAETQVQEEFLTIAGGDLQGNGAWNDIPADGCDNDPVISYVIEWSADCNNDGIIDFGQCRDGSLPDTNTNNIPDCCEQGVSCNNVDPCASQTVLFVDDFEAPALDSLKWDVRLPYACSLVQQGGGEVLMQARGHLVTRGEFSPRSGAIRLEYTFRYIAGVEAFEVNMLTNGDISGTCCSQPNNGIAFVMASWNEPTMAFVIGSANLQITNVVHSGSITVSMGDTFHVNLELTSTAIHADIRKKGSPLQSMSVSATWAGTPLGTKVAFYDRELCDARSAISKVSISRFGADCDSDGTTDACEIASGAPDINHNNIPDTCECIGDIYVDGIIDGGDLGVLLAYWGPTTSAATSIACDLNVDGVVSGSDLGILLAYWGPCSN
jgi:hypothetical protein